MSTLEGLLPAQMSQPALPKTIGGLVPGQSHWPAALNSPGTKKSAVAMILFCDNSLQTARILFIRRSVTLNSHRGQVGLPGGHCEVTDLSPWDCATRETFEEVGIPQDQLFYLGQLPITAALNGLPVIPVVAVSSLNPKCIVAAPGEVEDYFLVPWIECTVARASSFRFNMFGLWRDSSRYETTSGPIWGLTAKILESADLRS